MKAEKIKNAKGEERLIVYFVKDDFGNVSRPPFSVSPDELSDEADVLDSITCETGLKGDKAKEVLELIKSVK